MIIIRKGQPTVQVKIDIYVISFLDRQSSHEARFRLRGEGGSKLSGCLSFRRLECDPLR
jgi:hypothetical protein